MSTITKDLLAQYKLPEKLCRYDIDTDAMVDLRTGKEVGGILGSRPKTISAGLYWTVQSWIDQLATDLIAKGCPVSGAQSQVFELILRANHGIERDA